MASAADMAAYLRMLLAGGMGPTGRVVSADGVAQLLAQASPPGRSKLVSADFDFRYGEGWFVGPFGAAADARWHLGNLPSFAAWVLLLGVLQALGQSPTVLGSFAPDLALVIAMTVLLMGLPVALRAARWARPFFARRKPPRPA